MTMASFPHGTPVKKWYVRGPEHRISYGTVAAPDFKPAPHLHDEVLAGEIFWVLLPDGEPSGWWRAHELQRCSRWRIRYERMMIALWWPYRKLKGFE